MMTNEKFENFMKQIKMHPDQTDIDAVVKGFIAEMEKGLAGEPSSLAMIPTFISPKGKAPDGKPVIAIDAGGTNLRTAIVTFEDGTPVTTRFEKSAMPGSRGEVSVLEFFDVLAERILPLTEFSDTIGFCFSYPAEIFSNRDGKILSLTKEVKVRGAEGVVIGEALINKLRSLGADKKFNFIVLNDTVASLMGGVAHLGLHNADGMAGLILGTGYNVCYLESGEKIKKLPKTWDMIINCESGNFTGGGGGEADNILDAVSKNPGAFRFEKMMSGVYLGQLITHIAQFASQEGLLSADFGSTGGEYFTAPEIDLFIRGEDNRILRMCKGDDEEVLRGIVDMCFERAAKLVCANIAALCIHCGGGKSPDAPFYLVPEGSMFHSSLLFREKFDRYMDSYIKARLGRFVQIRSAENSTMAGAALAALLN